MVSSRSKATTVEDSAIERFKNGHRDSYLELFNAHSDKVLRFALRLTRDEQIALDVAQEVFLRAYEVLEHWRWEARFSTWLYRTTLNVCREFKHTEQRHFRKRNHPDPRKCVPVEAPDEILARQETALLIDSGIALLPPRQREVFVLKQFEQLSFSEIAGLLDLKEAGAKANYYKAVKNLRDYICYAEPDYAGVYAETETASD